MVCGGVAAVKSLGGIVGRGPFVAVGCGSRAGGKGVATVEPDLINTPVGAVAGDGSDGPVAEGLSGRQGKGVEAGRGGKGA